MKPIRLGQGWQRAAGELALIIIGVLCALWIEEWRQGQIDRETERDYLSRLILDLDDDLQALQGVIEHTERREAAALRNLAFLDSEEGGDARVVDDFNWAGFISFFRHRRATLDELLSTGNLRLILDKSLLREITNYYRSTDFLMEFDHQKREAVWSRYRPVLNQHLSNLVISGIANDDPGALESVDWKALKSDPGLRRGLEDVIGVARVERRMLERAKGSAETLKQRVTDALAVGPVP